MKCKLTGTVGKGVRAHIIPRSFCANDPDEKQLTKIYSTDNYPQKRPMGIWDDTIVTEEGEKIFTEWDDYAKRLLIDEKSEFMPLDCNGISTALQIPEYDYKKLKMFFLSVLWRASVSSQPFFRHVDLGPHEPKLREAILSGTPGNSDWFAVTLQRWSEEMPGAGMIEPRTKKMDGINYYLMYMEHYIVHLKVDQRPADEVFRSFQLRPNSSLVIFTRNFSESNERKVMTKMVTQHEK